MAAFSFGKDVRLNNAAEFQHVFADAQRYSSAGLTLLVRPNHRDSARLGLAIAKKQVKASHARNRVRRLAREAFRLQRHALPAVDMVLMCRTPVVDLDNRALTLALQRCFERLQRDRTQVSTRD